MLFPQIAKDMLKVLIEAQDTGKPIPLANAIQRWSNGSTWEDLVDGGYIERWSDGVLVTKSGRIWFAEH